MAALNDTRNGIAVHQEKGEAAVVPSEKWHAARASPLSADMNDRFRERLGYLSDELDSHLRSVSPQGSRSPRRASRSPRPHKIEPPSIVLHDSRPNIAAWPAPPAPPSLQHQSVAAAAAVATAAASAAASASASPAALSPNSIKSGYESSGGGSNSGRGDRSGNEYGKVGAPGPYEDYHEQSALLAMLRAAANESSGAPRGRESELKRKIQTLEDTVAEYERQKYNVMGTFTEYRERVQEREKKLEAEYSSKIILLSEEVLSAKREFEQRMKAFQSVQEQFEREKEQALEKLRQEHQKEIQLMEQRYADSQVLDLRQKYLIEIRNLEEERKSLRAEREQLGEQFEMKLRRAQTLYETELSAAKMLYTKELEALRDHEDALKEELLARQDEFHDRLQELQHQNKRSRDELATCKNEVTALEKKLHSKEAEVQQISQELEEARNETNDSLRRLAEMDTELEQTQEKYQKQEEELRRKSSLLDAAEAARSKLEAVIRDLKAEVKTLRNKVDFLETERVNLQSQSESQTQLQNSQVNALEAVRISVLESMTKEKESTKEHYESLLSRERQQAEAREHSMKKEFASKLNELEEQYTTLKEELEHSARLDKDDIREATQHEIESLKAERNLLASQVAALHARYIDDNDDKDGIDEQLAKLLSDSATLTVTLEETRQRLATRDTDVAELQRKLEQEHQITQDQLMVIRDEIRHELESATEFKKHGAEIVELHSKIAELELQCEKDEQEIETSESRRKELEIEKEQLRSAVQKLSEQIEKCRKEADVRLKEAIAQNERQLRKQFDAELKDALKKEAEKASVSQDDESERDDEVSSLHDEIDRLTEARVADEDKIMKLKSKCDELLVEMDCIKDELEQKNERIESINKTSEESKSQESRTIEKLEARLKTSADEHAAAISALQAERSEQSRRVEQLEHALRGLEESAVLEDDKPSLSDGGCQTDEIETAAPIAIIDLAREAELKGKIGELEARLDQKERLVRDLMERIQNGDEPRSEANDVYKKKDRSQSVGGEHAMKCQKAASKLHNMVNSLTEKKERKEEETAAKKKEADEKKAAKDAKEKSQAAQRSKSPSLLSRLRERSPKAKSPSIDPSISSSSRNLLSPSDAEIDRRSPSRPLFSRNSKKEPTREASALPVPPADSGRRPAWKF